MAISTVLSDELTRARTVPQVLIDRNVGKLTTLIDTKTVATTSIDEVGDVILFAPLPSNAVLVDVLFKNADLDTNGSPTLAANIGLYYFGDDNLKTTTTEFGDVVDADCIAAASTIFRAAVTTFTSVGPAIGDAGKRLWELAGLTSDPGGQFCVGITISAVSATPAAGAVQLRVDFI